MTAVTCNTRKDKVNQHYESQWEGYTEKDVLRRVENLAKVIEPIISDLPSKPNLRILDIGSGPGIIPFRIAKVFKESDFEMYGLDVSENALRLGNRIIRKSKLGDSIHLIKGDAENLPFKDNSFDAVVSNATINLLPDKEIGFDEIARVIKEGGKVVIADCISKEKKELCSSDESNDKLWSVCVAGAPTEAEMKKLAGRAGLEVIESLDLTDEVSRLVKNRLWDWPEFIEHGLEYHVFRMMKSR